MAAAAGAKQQAAPSPAGAVAEAAAGGDQGAARHPPAQRNARRGGADRDHAQGRGLARGQGHAAPLPAARRAEGPDAGAHRLRPDRPLDHGRPAGGPLPGAQPARARHRPLGGGLGQPVARRPLADPGRLHRGLSRRLRRRDPQANRLGRRSPCSASARAASSPPATPRSSRTRWRAGQHHHADRLPRRRGRRGAPGLRLHQPLDPQPAAGGDRPADRRPWHPARPFHGRGVLDDDADAQPPEVQPRPGRGGRGRGRSCSTSCAWRSGSPTARTTRARRPSSG